MTRTVLGVMIVLLVSACSVGQKLVNPTPSVVTYTIDHVLRPSGDLPPVSISHGQTLHVEIQNTNTDCYFYNAKEEQAKQLEAAEPNKIATLDMFHDESTIAYQIDVTPRITDTSRCPEGARSWRIPVRSLWNLSAAGGFAGTKLTDPVFFLTPGSHTKSDGTTEQGFTIGENRGARDDHKITGVAYAHLYESGLGIGGVNIAPLTFGLGVDSTRRDYMIGTSLRFGTRAYLTVGRVFGSVQRLPADLSANAPNNFTTNANALSDLPTRRAESWFVGLSFSFLEAGVSDLFKNRVGIPQVSTAATGQTTQTPTTSPNVVSLTVTPTTGKVKTKTLITITGPTGTHFGGVSDDSYILFHPDTGSEVKVNSKDLSGDQSWNDDKIKVNVPDSLAAGKVKVNVFKNASKLGSSDFTVTP
jgi:hypothetical protein